jgi:hypothetical protein
MSARIKIFKLIVQPTETCLELLRYVDKNIEDINRLGVGVRIEKISKNDIDEDLIEVFRKRGIVRLPTMLAPDGTAFTGLKQITALFEKNLNTARNGARADPYGGPAVDAEFGSNPDMTDFWHRELFSGRDSDGRSVPRKDEEEDENDGEDMTRRLAEYRRNEPAHRSRAAARERDVDPAPRRGRAADVHDTHDDNIADSPPRARARGGGNTATRMESTGDPRADDMDAAMLAAWMDNNAGEI